MITIKVKVKGEEKERELILSYAEYYDPLEEGETYQKDGVAKYIDEREYLSFDKNEVSQLSVSTLDYNNFIIYGDKSSITEHTIFNNGEEMLVIQDEIEPGVTHHVKLKKSSFGKWEPNNIELIYDKTATIVSLK